MKNLKWLYVISSIVSFLFAVIFNNIQLGVIIVIILYAIIFTLENKNNKDNRHYFD